MSVLEHSHAALHCVTARRSVLCWGSLITPFTKNQGKVRWSSLRGSDFIADRLNCTSNIHERWPRSLFDCCVTVPLCECMY